MKAVRASVVAVLVNVILSACDTSPTAPPPAPPTGLLAASAVRSPPPPTGLVACSQTYDSVTQVIGRQGGHFVVGHHSLYVDSLALSAPVSITAVAPSGTVRWVRLRPEGLVFQPTADGWSALLYTNYTDCGVSTSDTLRIAQVSDSLGVLGYLQTSVKSKKNPWSKSQQYVVGLLQHFSNYAVAW